MTDAAAALRAGRGIFIRNIQRFKGWYASRNIVYRKPSLDTTPVSYYSAYLPKDAASIESRTREADGEAHGRMDTSTRGCSLST